MARYRFTLNNGTESRICYPRWKADTALEYAFEQNQMFRRAKLTNNLVFVGADYDWIMATAFEQKITCVISADWAESGTYSRYWSGAFHKTDCTINVDNKSVSVKPEIDDRYSKILAGLDKEYDLIKLLPAIQPVTLTRRPMLQIYSKGESVLSCFLSAMAWEVDCDEVDSESALESTYYFGKIGEYMEIGLGSQSYIQQPFIGTKQTHSGYGEWNDFGTSGDYYMTYFQSADYVGGMWEQRNGLRIYRVGTQTIYWEYIQTNTSEQLHAWSDIPTEFTMTAKQTGYNDLSCTKTSTTIYGRWLLAEWISGSHRVSGDDLGGYNRNFKYAMAYTGTESVVMTYNSSVTPTEWGLRSDGAYFAKPAADVNIYNYFPIARTSWINASLWFAQTAATEALEVDRRVQTELRDAYTLEAVIKALLAVIDNTITFDATAIYSQFLYGRNPFLVGSASWGRLVMTPKSNVLVAEYTQPSQKAPITLNEVLKMLRDMCGCYWYINSSNQLCIEHISWFKNGGSYSGQQAIGLDVTAATNTRNGKAMSFGTNEYSYDKIEMPERYQYEWMDDTTEMFKGQPIEVVSTFVEQGKIEEITIAGFNPDVDYMMLNPSSISEDGFALLCCNVNNGVYSVPIADVTYTGLGVNKMQNWMLSMVVLQAAFLISDMPSWNIKVNGAQTTAKGIQRKKQQQINLPIGSTEPNTQLLVRTGIGTGEIKTMSVKLSSRMAKTTLVYDTTQQ